MIRNIFYVLLLVLNLSIFSQSFTHNFKLLNRYNQPCCRQSSTQKLFSSEVTKFPSVNDNTDVFSELKSKLRGTSVYFVGLMGSGKSSAATEFARLLGYRFLDTDELAEFMIEMPIADYFAQGREAEFRDVEYKVLMELSQYIRLAVATGGGCVTKQENWGQLRHGIVVFLDARPEDIYARLAAKPDEIAKRPLLREQDALARLQDIAQKRRESYEQADATVLVTPDLLPTQVAQCAAESILQFIASNPPKWEEWKRKREATAVEAAGRVSSHNQIRLSIQNIDH